ncbi:hypothetical protein [Flavobacterium sp. C4GT6]|uniref:hypothetical protein n=1 Tax=Flavobacterium sp. C4GT6 TaxID=3103818 RepID=UPI002ED34958
MRNNIWYYISVSFVFQYLLCGILLIYFYYTRSPRKELYNEFKVIKPFVWLMFIGELYEVIFSIILFVKTAYWTTLYSLLEFLAFNYMFYKLLKKYKTLYSTFNIVFLTFYITSLFFWNIDNHNIVEGYYGAIETVFIIIWAILWFKDLFKKDEVVSLWRMPAFYYVLGAVIYLCGGVIPVLFTGHLFKATGLWTKYWLVFLILGTFMRIMMIIGLLKATVKKP